MAKIVLGIGTSHSPMLSTPPEQWGQRVEADRRNPGHPFRGGSYSFDELVRMRESEALGAQITPEIWRGKAARCRRALDALAATYAKAAPDVAVIFGNDQREVIVESNMPAFTVFWGETIENIPYSEAQLAKLPPGIGIAEAGHTRRETDVYPGCPGLGRHIIESMMAQEFDVAQSTALPSIPDHWWSGIPHAFGFVYRQIMQDAVIPNVPLITNTFYPPNQPSVKRCHAFGRAVRNAIESWDGDGRVAVFCSGGLSHFVVDEELDRAFLDALAANDEAKLLALPGDRLVSGTSEMKNWIPLAGLLRESGLEMTLVDYVPCYRSEAGTGTGAAFAVWR